MCKNPCPECPFRRDSWAGYLGEYSSGRKFIGTHWTLDVRNPCHMSVDYLAEDWKERAEDAPTCAGQAAMYANACKKPRTWDLPEGTEPRADVFRTAAEFIAHHDGDD